MHDESNGHRPTVLIADDDLAIIDALEILLESEGYAVATIASGDIVRETERLRPDLVLLDIRMSGQDGREICRRLKAGAATRGTPVIMFSANHDGATMAREVGADDFLAKPFDMDELLGKVAAHLAGSGAR